MKNDKLKIKEIKTTSELGCMLDTERAWISVLDVYPTEYADVELKLYSGTVIEGYKGHKDWFLFNKLATEMHNSKRWEKAHTHNPVVAWRELVTDNK